MSFDQTLGDGEAKASAAVSLPRLPESFEQMLDVSRRNPQAAIANLEDNLCPSGHRVARIFRPMSGADVQALLAKTKDAAVHGEFELFKTTSIFDSTATHPDWLGEEPKRIRELMPA